MGNDISRYSRGRARSSAYVNPVVAVLVGYFLGGEALGLRTILGTLLVLISVVVITTTGVTKLGARTRVEDGG